MRKLGNQQIVTSDEVTDPGRSHQRFLKPQVEDRGRQADLTWSAQRPGGHRTLGCRAHSHTQLTAAPGSIPVRIIQVDISEAPGSDS